MILELDVGNSAIKWRLLRFDEVLLRGSGPSLDSSGLLDSSLLNLGIERCRLVSVRNELQTLGIAQELRTRFCVDVAIARPVVSISGVENGYEDFSMLGADRWLAILGAFNRYKTPCVVIDLGTAITVDWVGATGKHEGGYIVPGLSLMLASLEQGTQRVGELPREIGEHFNFSVLGRDTAGCVFSGLIVMIRAFIEGQARAAREAYGDGCAVVIAGGGYSILKGISGLSFEPELVFSGLAIACP